MPPKFPKTIYLASLLETMSKSFLAVGLVAVLLTCVAQGKGVAQGAEPAGRPNVVLILADDKC